MAKIKKKTKAEELQDAVAEAVGAGRELHLESVDFSDPNRPKTCLEVDFPILPINHVATIEGNAGKPIYQMSKWWARRRSSVFRAMLIAAATKAPEDQAEAAKLVWDSYYGNHQKNEAFRKLKVADIFMGGGTTIVEGSRLGMQMYGNDLNPVAWFVVKNEMAQVDPEEVKKLLNAIEAEVKPQIMPFYACDCPRGHKGKWTHKPTSKVMGADFDPLALKPEEREHYEYFGPEIIYAFWAKHGPCQATGCGHRTPIMSSPVIAIKTLTVKAWTDRSCRNCQKEFDIEQHEARMAPAALFVSAPDEKPYSVMDEAGKYVCPHCGHPQIDAHAKAKGVSGSLGKAKNKSIVLTLLIHPDWLKGASGTAANGQPYGGSATDDAESTKAWVKERQGSLKHIEVRGKLPNSIICPDTQTEFDTDVGTVPKKSTFICMESTCGKQWGVLDAIKRTSKTGPVALYAVQGVCPVCNQEGLPYSGRFFSLPPEHTFVSADSEWQSRKSNDLSDYWPTDELSEGWKTHGWSIPSHGFTHYWTMFNSRQLLVHAQLLRAISKASHFDRNTRDFVLGSFQQFLRNECMFSFWHIKADKLAPSMSNNNYHPKSNVVEVGAFAPMGYGPWTSTIQPLIDSLTWASRPWELVTKADLENRQSPNASAVSGKSLKVFTGDPVTGKHTLTCKSSTEWSDVTSGSVDLVITDPPFGEIMQYAELADFFYVWLKLAMSTEYPEAFGRDYSPKAMEAVANPFRNPGDPEGFYQRILTKCLCEANRILKQSGILSFTFHHSEDEPWIAVLESLFAAGFYLEATYPIRSDETKGEGEFGSQLIEYDIVHVCRKRLKEPEPISWARLRRQIMQDVRQLREIIEQHQKEGLGEADLQVIRRGKALEYYSRHYGKVYIEKGRESEFTVKDALLGINQLLDDERDTSSEAPPVTAEPYTRQFLRLFADKSTLDRDQMQKFLRGTGVSPSEFLERGWCSEEKKVFTITPPLEWAQQWKGKARKAMSRDFDQSYFLIGACYDESGIKVSDTLDSGGFVAHPAIPDLLDWFGKHGSDSDMKAAARRAKQIYSAWLGKNTKEVMVQHTLFDLESE
jgi:putative DNA methylase